MVELNASCTKVLRTVEILPESDENIIDACLNQDALVVSSLTGDGSHNKLRVYKHSGALWREMELPFDGTVSSISCAYRGSEFFFSISAADRPRAIYYHVFKSGKTRLWHDATFRPSLSVVNKVELVRSADGTMVPMHISHRADLKRGQAAPCLMSVYGGFAHAMLPGFNYQAWCWISEGGIYVQPYLRGGSELGDDWHLQATKVNKQKTYEDTLACAQFLIKEGYTAASRLAIMGASNGGLTVGAALARRPDLFGAAIITNGLLDMIKFADHSNGWSWMSEYGSVRNEAEFDCIFSYSPYHNINTRKAVPPIFFSASDSDDRVPAWHSYKYAARLAQKKKNFRSILSVKRSQGHSSSRPSNTALNELVFLQYIFGMQQIDDT